ncbi:MAG TPA: acyl-CoA dehydrogenase, partial [Rugosimonospora sp.]|nr:acyl-CoA dehydrogenase [Rugosimonospora sp.]
MTTELERLLGDPLDEDNPLSYAAVLGADERGEMLAAGEELLDGYRLNAEFVPAALGGRFTQADRLARVLRTVFRRDATLGLGYGFISFIAAAPVWTVGSGAQQRRIADLLLGGGRVAAGYTELPHGNDFTRNELAARPCAGGFTLDGSKELISNIARAQAVVLHARTAPEAHHRGHSHLLVDLSRLPAGGHEVLPRFPTVGVRGLQLAGIRFQECPVPADLVGPEGSAMETVLRAFQVTRGVIPGLAVGILDTQLRVVTRFALGRRLYGGTVTDLPHARYTLAGAFLDLLAADCLATVAARSLHLLPDQSLVLTAAAKYLVPRLVQEATYALSVLFGARSYLRGGPGGVFQKNARDAQLVTFGHANGTVCRATIIPQLHRLARHGWAGGEEAPAALFRLDEDLPPLDFAALALASRGRDSLIGTLAGTGGRGADPRLDKVRDALAARLPELRADCLALPARDRTVIAGPRAFALADGYANLLAA